MTSLPKCSSLDELNTLCKEVSDKTTEVFDTLVKQCNIDLNNNKQWSSQYYSLVKANTKLSKKIRRLRGWRWLMLIFLIFPFFLMTNAAKKHQAVLDEQLKKEHEAKDKLDEQLKDFVSQLSYDLMFKKIIEPLWKDINLDIYQDWSSYKSWLPLLNNMIEKDTCFTEIVSGKMFENPFMLYNYKCQTWYMHTYTGSIPVSYTTTDSQGHTVTRTEIVVATETLPAPQWAMGTELAYHFDKPANLCFINNLSKRQMKKLNKKNVQSPMENREFDKIFACQRTDEKDYRVVFTPLAQENFVKLFKQQQYAVSKMGDVTVVQIPSSGALLDTTDNEAVDYDLEAWKNKYCQWISHFVHTIGLLSLPIANIPLYTAFKTQLSNVNTGKQVASDAQVQENIHHLFNQLNLWSQFDTDVIFENGETKTITINKVNFSLTTVKCHYFWPDHKTIVKPAPSHRGVVMVPIHVIYYRPRVKNFVMCQSINLNNSVIETQYANNIYLHRGQLMFLSDSNKIDQNKIDTINKILQKIKKA